MIAPIFRSKLRQDILTLYFTHPENAYFLRELSRMFNCSVGSLQRELNCLSREGILIHENKANVKLFRLNTAYPLLGEMTGILQKTIGIKILMQDIVDNLPNVEAAFIYGSYVKSAFYVLDSLELLVIGGPFPADDLLQKIEMLQEGLKRNVQILTVSPEELKTRLEKKDKEMSKILRQKKIFLKGNEETLSTYHPLTHEMPQEEPVAVATVEKTMTLEEATAPLPTMETAAQIFEPTAPLFSFPSASSQTGSMEVSAPQITPESSLVTDLPSVSPEASAISPDLDIPKNPLL